MVDPLSLASKALVIQVAKKTPGVFSWFQTALFGKELLILGPPNAGKSAICEYLVFGELRKPESERDKTLKITEHKRITLDVGDQKRLTFRLKSTIDVPGQFFRNTFDPTPSESDIDRVKEYGRAHADIFLNRKCQCLLIVLDISEVASQEFSWIDGFVEEISSREVEASRVFRNSKAIFVALNKYDLAEPRSLDEIRGSLKDRLGRVSEGLRDEIKRVKILPTNGMETKYKKEYINYLIFEISKTAEMT
jgi:GTPase SAR1 family protein